MKVRKIRNKRMQNQSQMLATVNANLGFLEKQKRKRQRLESFIKYAKFGWYWTKISMLTLLLVFFIIVAMQLA